MTQSVRVSARAEQDADTIFTWLSQRSPEGAARWYQCYLATLRSLPNVSQSCGLSPEADSLGIPVRQVLFKTRKGRTFRALFVVLDNLIHVIGVRGGGQDFARADDLELPDE